MDLRLLLGPGHPAAMYGLPHPLSLSSDRSQTIERRKTVCCSTEVPAQSGKKGRDRYQIKNSRFLISEIPAVFSCLIFHPVPVVSFSIWHGPCHRIESVPGPPLCGVELFLFFLALFIERYVFVHCLSSVLSIKFLHYFTAQPDADNKSHN